MAVQVKKGKLSQEEKNNLVIHKLSIIAPNRNRQTVSDVRSAHKTAEFVHSPNRVALLDLYEDCLVDPFLSGVINKRLWMTINKGMRMVDAGGKHLEHMDKLIGSKEFRGIRRNAFMKKVNGLLGMEFLSGKKLAYAMIPPKHIKPHLGIISRDQYGSEGWDYTANPYLWVLQSNELDNNFGLLLKALPYVLFKRHGFVNWSGFVEIYGQPTRIAKYDAWDVKTREVLEEAMENAGRSLGMIIPKQADITFADGKTTNSDGKLQKAFVDACDEQISVLILGVTGTTKSTGADGYAQSKTHQEQQMEIVQADMENELETLNDDKFLNILRSYGYNIPEGAMFEHIEEADLAWLKEKLEVDIQLNNIIPISPQYFYETYNIPVPDASELPQEQPVEEEPTREEPAPPGPEPGKSRKPAKTEAPKKKQPNPVAAWFSRFFGQAPQGAGRLTSNVTSLYSSRCSICGGIHQPTAAEGDGMASVARRMAEMLYAGKISTGHIDDKLYRQTADMLMQGIYKGLGAATFDYYDNRNELAAYFQHNIHAFSAAKSLAELQHFNSLLPQYQGNRSGFVGAVSDAGYLFNKTYLETEYDTAYSSAQTAAEFSSFADGDVLQVSTAGDTRVRPEHQLLDGFTAYKSDAVWQKLCPPFDWNCRCRIVPGVASRISGGNGYDLVRAAKIPKQFQRNTALDKVVFVDGHPYYQAAGGTLKELAAVKNYGMRTVEQLYNTIDFPAAQVLESKEAANNWWTEKAGMLRGHIDIQDRSGVTVRFSNKFRKHVFEDNADERWRNISNIEAIITDPDEVWSFKEGGVLKKCYIRYYEDYPQVVKVDGTKAVTFHLKDRKAIDENTLNDKRRGALLYKK